MPLHPSRIDALDPVELKKLEKLNHELAFLRLYRDDSPLVRPLERPLPWPRQPPAGPPWLDVRAFGKALSESLQKSYIGHCVAVACNGHLAYAWARGLARNPDLAWSVGTPMHVASLSKFITSLAVLHGLHARGLTPDEKIHPYLPAFWTLADGVKDITFAHILTHRSGLPNKIEGFGPDLSSFEGGQKLIANGPTLGIGSHLYNNAAYGLARVLITILSGAMGRDDEASFLQWDLKTAEHYERYVQQHVFAPAGVHDAQLRATPTSALAHTQPYAPVVPGDDYGDLSRLAGGFGWFVSPRDYLAVATAAEGGRILPPDWMHQLKERCFGIGRSQLGAHAVPEHGGSWSGNATGVRSYFMLAPHNVQIVVFVNSAHPEHSPGDAAQYPDVWTLTNQAYVAHLKPSAEAEAEYAVSFISTHSAKALDVGGASTQAASALTQYDADGRANQRFRLAKMDDGGHAIVADHSGFALEPAGASFDGGRRLVQHPWTGRNSQSWRFAAQADGSQQIQLRTPWPDKVRALDVAGGSCDNGASIILYDPHDGTNQRWWVAAPIRSAQQPLVMDIRGGLDSPEPALIAFPLHNEGNQLFRVERLESGFVRIVALNGKVLDIAGASMADGAPAIVYPWTGGANQQFRLERDAQGRVSIRARHSHQLLQLEHDGGGVIVQRAQASGLRHLWLLDPLQYQGG